jgi:prepilin-type N-terminal cleavage/methylation domain-containing protein
MVQKYLRLSSREAMTNKPYSNIPSDDMTRFSLTHRPHGFTLMEVIVVIILLGILAVVAIARFTDADSEDIAAANTLKAHLRYAQLRAMGDVVWWGIEIESNQEYALVREDEASVPNLPGENKPSMDNISVDISPIVTIRFSPGRGQPIDSSGDPFSTVQTITVGSQTITITPETGFIP